MNLIIMNAKNYQKKEYHTQKYLFQKKTTKKREARLWTEEQDQTLVQLVKRYKNNWTKISSELQNRNSNQCLHRYRRIKGIKHSGGLWSPEQDEKVVKLVQKLGNNWVEIAKHFKRKTGKQIRERYINKLDPSIKAQVWTEQEDFKLIQLYNRMGSSWNKISKQMPGRPQNKIKNRFYSHIKRFYKLESQKENEQPAAPAGQPLIPAAANQNQLVPQYQPSLIFKDSLQLFVPMEQPVLFQVASIFFSLPSIDMTRMDSTLSMPQSKEI